MMNKTDSPLQPLVFNIFSFLPHVISRLPLISLQFALNEMHLVEVSG